jgi:hypothetical protein
MLSLPSLPKKKIQTEGTKTEEKIREKAAASGSPRSGVCRSSEPRKGRGFIYPIIESGVHTGEYSQETKFVSEMWHRERRMEVATHASVAFDCQKSASTCILKTKNSFFRFKNKENLVFVLKLLNF